MIAMPPCKQWCLMRAFARPDDEEKAIGIWCADTVRRWGGVLEQPAHSTLFAAALLPRPGQSDAFGFTISVAQFWWGHRARKMTWLYIAGLPRSEMLAVPMVLGEPTHCVGQSARGLKNLSSAAAEASPPAFARWLVETARKCQPGSGAP